MAKYYIQDNQPTAVSLSDDRCGKCGSHKHCTSRCQHGVDPLDTRSLTQNQDGLISIARPSSTMFCNDSVPLTPNDPNYVSLNQRLAGPPNPKTLIAPVIIAPPAALDYWRANNLVNHSHINVESQTDTYLSGYQVSNCCDRIDACLVPTDKKPDLPVSQPPARCQGELIEGYDGDYMYEGITDKYHPVKKPCGPVSRQIKSPTPVTDIPYAYTVGQGNQCGLPQYNQCDLPEYVNGSIEGYVGQSVCKEGRDARDPLERHPNIPNRQITAPTPTTAIPVNYAAMSECRENYEGLQPGAQPGSQPVSGIRPNKSGWVNTMCGYDPGQVKQSDLPSNLASGNCERVEQMKQYNKNLFTQTIQPDIYTVNQVVEPINSNIGISFTQQFEPTTCAFGEDGNLTYTEHDPRIYKPKIVPNPPDMRVTESNVFDPRFSGYGTSYRAYTDENIGQTRFYYDDVDAVRMPNYITRSNIDFVDYADSYGPLKNSDKYGNPYTNNIRALAQDTFLRSSINQRTDLQERLMRKRNGELWQLRKYPIHTMGQKC